VTELAFRVHYGLALARQPLGSDTRGSWAVFAKHETLPPGFEAVAPWWYEDNHGYASQHEVLWDREHDVHLSWHRHEGLRLDWVRVRFG
jgi:hypothetical protein